MLDEKKKSISERVESSTADREQIDVSAAVKQKISEKIGELRSPGMSGPGSGAVERCEELLKLLRFREWMNELTSDSEKGVCCHKYITSSLFLHRCYSYLKRFHTEAVHFVTGPQVNATYVLDTLLAFKMSKRSWGMALGDVRDTHHLLQGLDTYGQALTGYFHTHPGRGPSATHPSGTDLAMQKKLEQAGYPAIGAVFARDGFVRFFSLNRRFRIEVWGLRIDQEGECVYRLT